MNTEQQKETNRIIVCGVLGIIAMVYLALIGCVNVQHFNYKMNSDIGAEAVLARLIWNSGEMVPSTWISSTETRIIATPQLAALFVCAPWARSNGCKSRTRPDSGKCIAEQQGCPS